MRSNSAIGQRRFVDGITRDVFVDAEGQYVIDDDGEKIRGVWVVPEEDVEPQYIISLGQVEA